MKSVLRALPLLILFSASGVLAQTPPTRAPLPPGVQQMLNAPVWYLNYRIMIKSGGSYPLKWGGQGTVSEERFTSGTLLLGLRLQGPSFSSASLGPLNTPEAFDHMIGNFANWTTGMSPDESKTDQENIAAMERVMAQNRNAFARHSYQYQGTSGVGGTDRSSYSGSGTVQYAGTPAMEFDAANRKYRLTLGLTFRDSPASAKAVTGSGEIGIGSVHYGYTRVETGIYGPGSNIAPPIGFGPQDIFEGRIPETFGTISHSSVQDSTNPNSGLKQTVSFEFTLSPQGSEPAELIIEPPANYEQWKPIAGKDEKTAGDVVPIKVTLQKKGGGTPQFKAVKFLYWLNNTSREKGVCLNWPPNPEADTPFDLQFEDDKNVDVAATDQYRQSAAQTGTAMLNGAVNVSCFDYGAYGDFEAVAVLENGQVVHGVVKGTADQYQLKLPARKDGSLIATAFLDQHGITNLKDDDDEENEPVGDKFKGDGLTLYEEYRGFIVGSSWTAGDPKKKDVFVLNELRYVPAVALGIKHFENATRLKVHSLLWKHQVQADNTINFNRTSGPHVVDQHVIRIVPTLKFSEGATSARALNIGPPGKAKMILMPPDLAEYRGVMFFAATVAHEMLHCCNVFHHGDKDKTVWWYYTANNNQIYECDSPPDTAAARRNATAITVKYENGIVVLPGNFFPPDLSVIPVDLGLSHGQHSGTEYCMMRYNIAVAYPSSADAGVRFLTGGEPDGLGLCSSRDGTGVNGSRMPQSRYSWAALPVDGGPLVLKDRGNCEGQIRVSDSTRAPAPIER